MPARTFVLLLAGGLMSCGHVGPTQGLLEWSKRDPGRALVWYLRATSDGSACRLRGPGEHLARIDEGGLRQLAESLVADDDPGPPVPEAWEHCWLTLLTDLDTELREYAHHVLADVVPAALALTPDRRAGTLSALAEVVMRGKGPTSGFKEHEQVFLQIARTSEDPRTRAAANKWLAIVEIEEGRVYGHVATETDILGTHDLSVLRWMGERHPSALFRRASNMRLVGLLLDKSPYHELVPHADEVIERLVDHGYNRISLRRFPPAAAALLGENVPDAVLLRSTSDTRAFMLLPVFRGSEGRRTQESMPLLPSLRFRLQGLRAPAKVCAPNTEFDLEPCIHLDDLQPFSGTIIDGSLHLGSGLDVDAAVELLNRGVYELGLHLAGKALLIRELAVKIDRPPPLVFSLADHPNEGTLPVHMQALASGAVMVTVSTRSGPRVVLSGPDDLASMGIHSVGHPGQDGHDGRDGEAGKSGNKGSDARCPNTAATSGAAGGAGGPGSDGTPGTDGGDGGDIAVTLDCRRANCDELERQVRTIVRSLGGRAGHGGKGGKGGKGGAGGAGGSSVTCKEGDREYELPAGAPGPRGPNGPAGNRGFDGRRGRPGQVTVTRIGRQRKQRIVAVTVFVLDPVLIGSVAPSIGSLLSEGLLTRGAAVHGVQTLGSADLDALLDVERQKDLLGCMDISCMAEIAGSLGADLVLRTSVGRMGTDYMVHLTLLDTQKARVIERTSLSFASEDAVPRAGRAFAELLERHVGLR